MTDIPIARNPETDGQPESLPQFGRIRDAFIVRCRAGWWSQAGSNRRPRHCERRALPAELWPHRGSLANEGGQQSAPFTIRAKAKSRTEKPLFSACSARNFPCLRGGEPIFSRKSNPRPN